MHKLASTKTQFILAALVALTSVACGGGDDDNGGDGTGGTGGGGGGAGPGTGVLVTDFESGNFDGYAVDDTKGWTIAWFTFKDPTPTGMITPAAGSAFASIVDPDAARQHVGNMKGSGFTEWGAGMGFNFKSPAVATDKPGSTDLSAYKGISFWAKTGNLTTGIVQVKVVDVAHAEVANGGTCMPGTLPCNNTYTSMQTIGQGWKQYTLKWADFNEATWGQQFPRDLTKIIGLQFQVEKNADFDLSVDNVVLTP